MTHKIYHIPGQPILDTADVSDPDKPCVRLYRRSDGAWVERHFDGTETIISGSSLQVRTVTQAGHGFAMPANGAPLPVYVDAAGTLFLAQADDEATLRAAFITQVFDANTVEVSTGSRFFESAGHGLVVGQYYFLSQTVAGDSVSPEPDKGISDVLYYVCDADTLILMDRRPVHNSDFRRHFAIITNTNTTTNLNLASAQVPIGGTIKANQANCFTIGTNEIRVPEDRIYECEVNLHITTANLRSNLRVQFAVNGTLQPLIGSSGYIRAASGHNESSIYLRDYIKMAAGDILSVYAEQEGAPGTVRMMVAGSSQLVVRMS